MEASVRFARSSDGTSIAYSATGSGTPLVYLQPFTHQELDATIPMLTDWFRAVGEDRTLVRFDMRRFGLSQRGDLTLTIDALADDVAAVVEAAGIESFDPMAISGLTLPAMLYASAHGDRVRHLILWGAMMSEIRSTSPRARVINFAIDEDQEIDVDGGSIEHGTGAIKDANLEDRISLHTLGAEAMDFDDEFDLVSLNIVLHELLPDLRLTAVQKARRALKPGGVLISNDFHYPSRLEDVSHPRHQTAILDQRFEVTWGNRHLSREQIEELLRDAGFASTEFYEFEIDAPGGMVGILTAIAHT